MKNAFLGIDVGSTSARAGLFDAAGTLLGQGQSAFETYRPAPHFVQQSSQQIWAAICLAVSDAMQTSGCAPHDVAGIGFDATCSLVVSDATGAPVSVDPDGAAEQDIIVWMDHRATLDADAINLAGGQPLKYVGGRVSPEMQLPKLRWLKRELPAAWSRAAKFWDLPDWLVNRATGADVRSLCSTVCKWTYLGHQGSQGEGWDDDFLTSIGLTDLTRDSHRAIGHRLAAPGTNCGGLSARAATELGLTAGTPVAASMIDAHAGALGTLGLEGAQDFKGRLAIIAGTSTCHITLTPEAAMVPGIWGPYFGAVLPDLWALEAGQSAAGALLDTIIARHGAYDPNSTQQQRPAAQVEAHLATMAKETVFLTRDRHVQPDFHGNRSPLADPQRMGAIAGLTLDVGMDDLARDYLATLQALAYGTRHIIDEMRLKGVIIDTLVMSGGLAQNPLYVREHADATGCRVLVPMGDEPVLLGSAMLGAVAGGQFPTLDRAMAGMSGRAHETAPRGGDIADFHAKKYKVFRRMQDDFSAYQAIMEDQS